MSNIFTRTRIIINSRAIFNKHKEIGRKCLYNTLESSGRNDSFSSQRFAKERLQNNRSWSRRSSEDERVDWENEGEDYRKKSTRSNSDDRWGQLSVQGDFERGYERKKRAWVNNDYSMEVYRDNSLKSTDKDSVGMMNSDFGDVGSSLPQKVKRKKKEKPPPPPSIEVPGFVRISGARQNMVVYFEELRRESSKRNKFRSLLIHGCKHIQSMIKQGIDIKSIGITTAEGIKSLDGLMGGSREIFNNKEKFPAERYYVTDLEWTRKILGSGARVDAREAWAELPFPNIPFPSDIKKLLVLDHIADPVDMGMLIRSAKALRWDASYLIAGTVDLYNETVIRTSRCESVTWPSKTGFWHDAYELAKEHNLTLVMADMLPRGKALAKSSTGLCFWDPMTEEVINELPSRIALILGSKLHGVTYRDVRSGIMRVSIPMHDGVSSLNVGMAGNILMHELNRLMDTGTKAIVDTNN
ncbi:7027_t:CDS:1 [Acaulospora colombiana]|uniref:7027_t:CDS:1 n=1 Tax=Acaulospora colombiana TaxID=27376 RepID=A0ACA9LX92_9GLOM|nr:7027_t:CDS:1 [Acaulospora colombiana]